MGDAATRGRKKVMRGVVDKVSSQKTISVTVLRRLRHPKYGKFVTKSRRYLVHDAKSEAGPGDSVEVMVTRPLSARKRWRLLRVVQKAPGSLAEVSG